MGWALIKNERSSSEHFHMFSLSKHIALLHEVEFDPPEIFEIAPSSLQLN